MNPVRWNRPAQLAMSRIDLLLLHPPSVYDFRKHAILYGPVSDLIPSSPVFEMYPLGFLTLTDYLEARGFSVCIVNLALRMIKMVLRYRDLQSVLPFNGWLQNPITAVFTVKGCRHECVTCGSSRQACATVSKRTGPLFRSPNNLVGNMTAISQFSKGPIFLVGDLRQAGHDHALEVLSLLKKARLRNQIVFELFEMPPPGYLQQIDRAVANWSLELSPESHEPAIRRLQDSTTSFSNQAMEAIIQESLQLRCQPVDVFFMIGLPRQTRDSVKESVSYCGHLFANSDPRLSCFISPMGPFLDPGSQIFEHPDRFGYHLFARSLEEHRQLLVQPSWKQILNYETDWMTRDDLVEATYDTAEFLNLLKLRHGRIRPSRGQGVARRIQRARALKHRLDAVPAGESPDQVTYRALLGDIHEFSVSTVCDKRELFWRRHLLNFKPGGILRAGLRRCPTIRTSNP